MLTLGSFLCMIRKTHTIITPSDQISEIDSWKVNRHV